GPHGLQGEGRVLQALALRGAGARGREVDDVRGETLRCDLERDPRSGRVLVEEVDHGASPEGWDLLDDPGSHLSEALRGIEDPDHVLAVELVDRQEMLDHAGVLSSSPAGIGTFSPTTTASSPSVSVRRTRTSSSRRVGTFLPT